MLLEADRISLGEPSSDSPVLAVAAVREDSVLRAGEAFSTGCGGAADFLVVVIDFELKGREESIDGSLELERPLLLDLLVGLVALFSVTDR